ncbi:ferrochelatase [Methylococcus geothermalis]|uniref:Ferrochelatase n=1 Tax=Methylococcus geothermalis TaxID=2681310 RepID=A0A858Q7V8_9GAMM|nr:ferrochelatase [Methylococcus geothermalis]QJD29948.1 ferrochelatase [Methylococcus geothermalis]
MNSGTARLGVLLVNLGTPDAPTPKAVRRYLREFLSDPRVVEIPRALWWLILNLIVLRIRPRRSAHAYRTIWTDRGSPLLAHTEDLRDLLAADGRFAGVEFAMRYGNPSIRSKLEALKRQAETIVILPLYPQYSAATTGSVFDAVCDTAKSWRHVPGLHFISDYYRAPAYLEAVASSIRSFWQAHGRPDRLLFSFHGLPKRCVDRGDPYAGQCQHTAREIAALLGLNDEEWLLAYQSRFGRAEWLKPYCIDTLRELPVQGIRRVDVVCPGFAVDCLETLEEIAVTNRGEFLGAGGECYRYIPALNARPEHAKALIGLLEPYLALPG